MTTSETCPFCITKEHTWLTNWGVPPEKVNNPLIETNNLIVMPDLLPVSDIFHLIIKTVDHKSAFGVSPELDKELSLVLELLEFRTGYPLIVAEHGGSATPSVKSSVQSIHHRHLHVVPGTIDATNVISKVLKNEKIDYQIDKVRSRSPLTNDHLLSESSSGFGYLYIHDYRRNAGLLAPDRSNSFPSQITQRNLAIAYLGEFHNWKELQNSQASQQIAAQRIISTIERCQEK